MLTFCYVLINPWELNLRGLTFNNLDGLLPSPIRHHVYLCNSRCSMVFYQRINRNSRPLLHPPLYSEYMFDKCGFDGRLWPDKKMFTFWWCTDRMDFEKKEVLLWTQTICEKLKTGDWVVPSLNGKKVECPEKVDITEYTFMFIGIVNDVNSIIRCSYDEFIKGDFELYDCSKLRFFVPSNDSPYLRRVKIKREEPKEKSQYQLSCEYWDRKIGSMDVAEWHLLMYEE